MPEPKRQLAAIMFTDIVGYTALMGSDETRALELLREIRGIHKSLITEYHGKLLKEMGDGFLAKFSSVLDAVLCASKIQKRAKDLDGKIRIGIHLGDVTVENEDIFGDGVNIASRLQSIANPGSIFVSDSVYKAIKSNREIESRYLGDVQLKNVSEPVTTYVIAGDGLSLPTPTRIRELTGSNYITSLAVLPFKNLSGDPDQQYFADGMQDALIGELSQISALRVISRTSTLRYRDSIKTVPDIASELGVDGILEATVFRNKNMVRINTQLIKAFPREEHLWSNSYDKEIKDVFTLYNEVVRDITSQLGATLTSFEAKNLETAQELDPKAYEAYLKGLFHWEKLAPADLETSLVYFEQTSKIDPKFAPAYSGMAGVWLGRMQMGLVPPKEAVPRIEDNIRKTLTLDVNIAEAHFWNATLSVWVDWDWVNAQNAFETTIRLNPNHSLARAYYSHLMVILGRTDDALKQIEKSIDLDPFNLLTQSLYGMVLNYARNYDKAIEVLTAILNDDHNHPLALSTLRSTYHNQGDFAKAFKIFKQSYREKGDMEAMNTLQNEYEENGYHAALEKIADLMISRSGSQYDTPWQIGTLYSRAGLNQKAIKYLNEAYAIRDSNMPYLGIDPIFDGLRDDPCFIELLDKMKLDSIAFVEQ